MNKQSILFYTAIIFSMMSLSTTSYARRNSDRLTLNPGENKWMIDPDTQEYTEVRCSSDSSGPNFPGGGYPPPHHGGGNHGGGYGLTSCRIEYNPNSISNCYFYQVINSENQSMSPCNSDLTTVISTMNTLISNGSCSRPRHPERCTVKYNPAESRNCYFYQVMQGSQTMSACSSDLSQVNSVLEKLKREGVCD